MRYFEILNETAIISDAAIKKAAKFVFNSIDMNGFGLDWYHRLGYDDEAEVGKRQFTRELKAHILDHCNDTASKIEWMFRNGKLTVYREITAPTDWTPDPNRHPGVCWSWDKDAAEAHWGSFSDGHVKWLLTAEIRPNQVNWPITVAMNADPSYEEEKEIRIKEFPINFTYEMVADARKPNSLKNTKKYP